MITNCQKCGKALSCASCLGRLGMEKAQAMLTPEKRHEYAMRGVEARKKKKPVLRSAGEEPPKVETLENSPS